MADVVLDITAGLSIPLTTFALTFEQRGAIADKVAPRKPVMLRSAPFPVWDKKSLYLSGSALVGPDGDVEEIKEKLGSDTYAVKDFGRKVVSPLDDEAEFAALGINKEQRDTKKIMNYLAIERETRAAAIVMTAANYAAGNTAAPLAGTWDLAASTPLQDFARAIRSVIGMSLRKIVVLGREVWDVLRFNTQVLAALGRPGGQTNREIASASQQDVAMMLGVDDVLVGDLQFNANNDGVAALDRDFIWSQKHAAVLVCPREEDLVGDTLSFAITFRLVRSQLAEVDFGGLPATAIVRRWFDESRGLAGAWHTVGGYSEQIKVTSGDAGFLITNVIP
jgi:hypothetical protein